MSRIISGFTISKDVCLALGLDPKKVISISIHIPLDDVVHIETKEYVYEEEAKRLVTVLRTYTLTSNLVEEKSISDENVQTNRRKNPATESTGRKAGRNHKR